MPNRNVSLHIVLIIEIILAVAAIIAGLYLMTPLFDLPSITANSPLLGFLGSTTPLVIYGAVYIITGIAMIVGVRKRKQHYMRAGLFSLTLLKFYGLISVFMVSGFLPLTWLQSAVTLVIAAFLWWSERKRP